MALICNRWSEFESCRYQFIIRGFLAVYSPLLCMLVIEHLSKFNLTSPEVGLKTDGKNPVSVRPFFYIYPVFWLIRKRDGKVRKTGREMGQVYPGAGREMGEEVSVRICGIPFFNQNILFFIPFLTYTE